MTRPNGQTPPDQRPATDWHGRGGLWTEIGTNATVVATRPLKPPLSGDVAGLAQPDGSVYTKFFWVRDRRAFGGMRVVGRRLDGAAGRLHVTLDLSHGLNSRTVPSSLTFSGQGCWQVVAYSGRATLDFVLRVVNETVHP